jgi:hypothetical protein
LSAQPQHVLESGGNMCASTHNASVFRNILLKDTNAGISATVAISLYVRWRTD